MGEKIAGAVVSHHLSMALVKERESPSGGAGIDSLPQPVEHENRLIEQCVHDLAADENIQLAAH